MASLKIKYHLDQSLVRCSSGQDIYSVYLSQDSTSKINTLLHHAGVYWMYYVPWGTSCTDMAQPGTTSTTDGIWIRICFHKIFFPVHFALTWSCGRPSSRLDAVGWFSTALHPVYTFTPMQSGCKMINSELVTFNSMLLKCSWLHKIPSGPLSPCILQQTCWPNSNTPGRLQGPTFQKSRSGNKDFSFSPRWRRGRKRFIISLGMSVLATPYSESEGRMPPQD